MSKLYNYYKECKEINPQKTIIIKSGAFYVMVDEDAEKISKLIGLKLTQLNETIKKCGFPISSLAKYENMLKNNSVEYIITSLDNYGTSLTERQKMIINKIKMLNLETISSLDALHLLSEYKNLLD